MFYQLISRIRLLHFGCFFFFFFFFVFYCHDFELHFTVGRNSFRYTRVDEEYKANRVGVRAPKGLYELKKLFVERNPDKAFMWSEFEADDVVGSHASTQIKFKKHQIGNSYQLELII